MHIAQQSSFKQRWCDQCSGHQPDFSNYMHYWKGFLAYLTRSIQLCGTQGWHKLEFIHFFLSCIITVSCVSEVWFLWKCRGNQPKVVERAKRYCVPHNAVLTYGVVWDIKVNCCWGPGPKLLDVVLDWAQGCIGLGASTPEPVKDDGVRRGMASSSEDEPEGRKQGDGACQMWLWMLTEPCGGGGICVA